MSGTPEWVTITESEEVLLDTQPSLVPYLTTLVGEVVLIGLGAAILLAGGILSLLGLSGSLQVEALPVSLPTAIAVVLIAWGGLGIASTLIGWWTTRYLVTTDELYRKTGALSRSVRNTRMEEVKNTGYSQSILGRLGSYGTVRIQTAGTGGTDIVFAHVGDPEAVTETIARRLDDIKT